MLQRTYETPMHLAASGGHYDLMQFVMEKGGSLEDEDKVRPFIFCETFLICVGMCSSF